MGAETACRYRGKRMAHSIIEAHRANPVEEGTGASQHKVDEEHPTGRGPYLWPQFVEPKACHLCGIEVAVLHFIDRDEGKREDHDTKTAYPLRDGSPKEKTFRQAVYIGDAGGTCRGEAAHGLEEGTWQVHVRKTKVRHHAYDGEDNPRECHNEEVVGPAHPLVLFLAAQKDTQRTDGNCAQSREQETEPTFFVIEESNRHRKQQEEALHDDKYAKDAFLHLFTFSPFHFLSKACLA
jgi:hypothetical protein